MRNLFYLLLLLVVACTSQNSNDNTFKELTGDYLGMNLPGDSAQLFAPGIVSSGLADRDIAIYPDGSEIYFCRNAGGFKAATIFYVKRTDGKWSEPKVAEFAIDPRYIYIEPHITLDGSKFYFASNKQASGEELGSMEIWCADRIDDHWGEPYNLGAPINTESDQYFPSLTKSGNLYFTSEDSLTNEEFIYRSKLVDGVYQKPEMLPENVNMGRARFNTFISPDEDYMIVPAFGMPDSYGATDYYIVFRNEEDQWSKPMNMGNKINSNNGQEWSASLTPDGKYIFFMSAKITDDKLFKEDYSVTSFKKIHNSPQNSLSDIYWISADFIKELKKQAIF